MVRDQERPKGNCRTVWDSICPKMLCVGLQHNENLDSDQTKTCEKSAEIEIGDMTTMWFFVTLLPQMGTYMGLCYIFYIFFKMHQYVKKKHLYSYSKKGKFLTWMLADWLIKKNMLSEYIFIYICGDGQTWKLLFIICT